jgi:hypothetical protein
MLKRNRDLAAIAGATALAGILAFAAFGGLSSPARKHDAPQVNGTGGATVIEQTEFYCNVKALTPTERANHARASEELARARIATVELADGYAFQLRSENVSLADLADWVTSERKCCPFFDFEIELEREGGPLWLKLKGKEGVKQFIRVEFGIR